MTNQDWTGDMDRERSTGKNEGGEGSKGTEDRSGWRGVTDRDTAAPGNSEGVLGGESWQDPNRQSGAEEAEDTTGTAEQASRDDLSRS